MCASIISHNNNNKWLEMLKIKINKILGTCEFRTQHNRPLRMCTTDKWMRCHRNT